jgi:hypothetical protein
MIMAPELPSRPKPDPDEEQTIIDPQDRIKSAHDKPDPRFEAARQKAAREEKVYAERADRTDAAEGDPGETPGPDELSEPDETPEPGGTFSFNMTGDEAEETE